MKTRLRALVALLFGSVLLSGCDFDVYSIPLPGGADVGDNAITVEAMFVDVLDLVPQSTVKVNEVSVGQVTEIELEGQVARVTMEIRGGTELPDDTIAEIRQTSLLGEKFVQLAAPEGGGDGELADGDEIPLERTGRNPEVEEVLGALSLLLNGGGVAQLKTIASELNLALEGREDSVKSVLTQVDSLMGQLDDNKANIVNAIESLNRLALSVRAQQGTIDAALEELPSALTSLDQQRGDLVKMLQALNRLGDVGVQVIKASKDSTIESIRLLQPVLTGLADSGDSFVKAFHVFLTYPFVDEVVGRDPQVARNLHMGDYTNLSVTLDIDLADLPAVPGIPCTPLNEIPDDLPIGEIVDLPNLCQAAAQAIAECVNNPSLRTCGDLPGALIDAVCDAYNGPLPLLLLCPDGTGGPGGPGLPQLPQLPQLPGLPLPGGLGGLLNRPAFGEARPEQGPTTGPTMGQLMAHYDPALVSLLIPGMVVR